MSDWTFERDAIRAFRFVRCGFDAQTGVARLVYAFDDGAERDFDVVGPICESSDVFGHSRGLPAATAEGDVMLIADAGAYGYSMASHYNLRALPEEEVLE